MSATMHLPFNEKKEKRKKKLKVKFLFLIFHLLYEKASKEMHLSFNM
jgi:hypothetical protein